MPRIRIPLLYLVALLISAQSIAAEYSNTELTVITQVEYLESEQLTPPLADSDWQPLELPIGDRIGDRSHQNRVIWMRFTLPAPDTQIIKSLYFYRYNQALDVYFNGMRIGGDDHKENRQTVSWNRPKLIDIQPGSWHSSTNVVLLRFEASYFGGTFSSILYGDRGILFPLYEATLFRQIEINQWLQITGILVTVLAFALWLSSKRKDPIYILFAGMTFTWTLLTTHMVMYYSFIDYRYWLPILHFSTDCFGYLMFHFLQRLTGIRSPGAARFMTLWLGLSLVWHLIGPYEYWWLGSYGFHTGTNAVILLMLTRIVRKAVVERGRLEIAISATLGVQLLFFLHDLLLILIAKDEDWETAIYFTQFAFPLMLLVFTAVVLQRFVSALTTAENLNRDLEAKVEASRQLIEKTYAEHRALEIEQAAAKERTLIYRDLHDDVGSKLLSIVHAGTDSKLKSLARAALESLRNAVSRANTSDQMLTDFLNETCEEARLRLVGSGHEFEWQQPNDLPPVMLSAVTVFNLNQALREIVSNIIRHAQASKVEFKLTDPNGELVLHVTDNGIGFQQDTIDGNGLNNIKQRVSEIGGEVSWQDQAPEGLAITLLIPC